MRSVRLSVSGRKGKEKRPGKEGWTRVRLPETLGNQGRMGTRQTGKETDCTSHEEHHWYPSQWLSYP